MTTDEMRICERVALTWILEVLANKASMAGGTNLVDFVFGNEKKAFEVWAAITDAVYSERVSATKPEHMRSFDAIVSETVERLGFNGDHF